MEQRFVSKTIIPSAKPPKRQNTVWSWLKDNLFSTPTNTVISIVLGCLLIDLLIPLVNWMLINAVWDGADRTACATQQQGGTMPNDWNGACWAFVKANFWQFIYGRYPDAEKWRVNLLAAIVLIINIPLLMPSVRHKLSQQNIGVVYW